MNETLCLISCMETAEGEGKGERMGGGGEEGGGWVEEEEGTDSL